MNFLNEIIKTGKPEQFPKDEILNEDDRLVRSWMSVEIKDKQGDIIPVSAIKKVLNTWFKRGATMIDQHTNRPIGKGLNWQEKEHPETGRHGIVLDYQVFKDYSIDDVVWNEIKDGKRTGLSIGGRSLITPTMKKDGEGGEMGKYHKSIELYEVSPVDNPANQLSNTIALNYMAKSLNDTDSEQLLEDLKKGYEGEIKKPFAGFDNFDSCVVAQTKKGHNEDAAKRICGFIMHKTEKKFMKPEDQVSEEDQKEEEVAKEMVPGGLAQGKTPKDIANKYKTTEDKITDLIVEGIKVEREHTDDDKVAQEIAMDHLWEDKDYYKKLKTIEKMQVADIKKQIKVADIKKGKTPGIPDGTGPRSKDGTCSMKKEWPEEFIKAVEARFMKNKRTIIKYDNGWPSDFVKALTTPIEKGRVYLKPGQQAPQGVKVQQGARGGKYYEEGAGGKEQEQPTPEAEKKPEEKPEHKLSDARKELIDSLIRIDTQDLGRISRETQMMMDKYGYKGAEESTPEESQESGKIPEEWGYDANSKEKLEDYEGNEIRVGSKIRVHPELTTDPANHKGDEGTVVGVDKDGNVLVEFGGGEKYGAYTPDSLMDNQKNPHMGSAENHGKDSRLKNFDIDNLDPYEHTQYDRFVENGQTPEEALQTIINSVEGDYSQLSDELAQIAEAQDSSTGSQEMTPEENDRKYREATGKDPKDIPEAGDAPEAEDAYDELRNNNPQAYNALEAAESIVHNPKMSDQTVETIADTYYNPRLKDAMETAKDEKTKKILQQAMDLNDKNDNESDKKKSMDHQIMKELLKPVR